MFLKDFRIIFKVYCPDFKLTDIFSTCAMEEGDFHKIGKSLYFEKYGNSMILVDLDRSLFPALLFL